MKKLILLLTIATLIFSTGQSYAQQDPNDPGAPDSVWFCPETLWVPISQGEISGSIFIEFVNDDTVGAISIPLTWSGPVILDSVSFEGTRVDTFDFNTVNIDPVGKKVLVCSIPVEEQPIPPDRGKLGALWFTFEESAPITLDTVFFPPINTLRFVTLGPVAYTPQFTSGGSFPIRTYTPGELVIDQKVDVVDLVFLVNYVFKSGTTPDPLIAADVNGDCTVDVVDIVSLVNYVFKLGEELVPGCVGVGEC